MVGCVVCVECSLRNDYLCKFAFCKHSNSPVFNRDKRTLNRLPIYLGEEVIDKINKEAVLKDIKGLKVLGTSTGGFKIKRSIISGDNEVHMNDNQMNIHNLYDSCKYGAWKEGSNSIDYNFKSWITKINCSYWVRKEYEDKRNRIRKIKNWWKRYKHNKIMVGINKRLNPEYNTTFLMQQINKDFLTKNYIGDNWLDNGFSKDTINERNGDFVKEISLVRINQYNRFKNLYDNATGKYKEQERMYYLLEASKLKMHNFFNTHNQESRDYHYLGTEKSHRIAFFTDNHSYRKQFLDYKQNIYIVANNQSFSRWDIYSNAFLTKYRKYEKFSGLL
jgi:hypothetical protein